MFIDTELIYYDILNGEDVSFDLDEYSYSPHGYENVPKEVIREILVTYFQVDFGYDAEAWKEYIDEKGGFYSHFNSLYPTEAAIRKKHRV